MSPGLSSSPRCLPLPDFLCPEVMSQSSTVSLPQNHQEEAVGSPMCPPHPYPQQASHFASGLRLFILLPTL